MGPQTLTPTLTSLTVKALFTLPFLREPRCCNQSLTTPQTALGRRHSQHLIDPYCADSGEPLKVAEQEADPCKQAF